jgi:hypothetical protein
VLANLCSGCINPAFQRAKQQLTKPFRFGQWVRLAFVGFLAGETGSGGCTGSFNWNSMSHQRGSRHFLGIASCAQLARHPEMFAGLITLLVVLVFVLVVLFIYVNSVMRFVLFDSIVARECRTASDGFDAEATVAVCLYGRFCCC